MQKILAVINDEHDPDRRRRYAIDPVAKPDQKKSDD